MLGKTVREHMLSALGVWAENARMIDREEEAVGEEFALLELNMPLITLSDLEKVAERMRAKGIAELRLAGDRPSKITLKSGKSGYFANDSAFLQIVDAKSYSMVYNHMRRRIVDEALARGVNIPFADSVIIDSTAHIEAGANILPFCRIEGASAIRAGAVVQATYVRDSEICEGAKAEMSHIADSRVGKGATVGPFARLRGATIADNCRIGDFVEVKASTLGENVKAAHLAYVGDAQVGEHTNIGCGAVFCNFDGKQKHKTVVGKDCFLGANCNLVAPISVGDGAFVAAGTTVTQSVAENTFTIGRSRQDTKFR